jgi:PKD repeat protein
MLIKRVVPKILLIFAFCMIFIVSAGPTSVAPVNAGLLAAPIQQSPNACPCSLWPDPVTPTYPYYDNPLPIEMGLKFRASVAGKVTGVRFFKADGATGTHIGRLWTMGGVKLAEVTFTNETASGWQSTSFSTPVDIEPDTTYIISYYVADGNRRFSLSQNYFTSSGVTNGPLYALQDGDDGFNGVYSDTGGFFNQANLSSNYWVDLIFDDTPDFDPPTIESVSPIDGATDVPASSIITVTFNEAMDAASINTDTFELHDPLGVIVPATVSYDAASHTGVLDPATNLSFSTTYTALVKGGSEGVLDRSGNPLAADYFWTFTTESTDTTPPTVASVLPENGAVEVPLSANVEATFSEAMDEATIIAANFELRDLSSNLVMATVTYDAGTNTALLDPATDLVLGEIYTARVTTGVTDLAGNALASDYLWTFSTVTPPAVSSVKPIDGVTRLRLATKATAYFSKAMDPVTINAETFELLDDQNNPVEAAITYNSGDNSATLSPTAPLDYSTNYTIRVKGGSGGVKDATGYPMAADFSSTFGTVAQRPPVDQGPGGPILVITSPTNLYTSYYAEILRTEGLNEFELVDASLVTADTLPGYDLVILGDMALTSDQVSMLTAWVTGGGNLIALRPDKQLAGLLGLTDAATTISEGYLLIDTSRSPGTGIVGQTLQFHGTADAYTLDGAISLATLYSDRTTATAYPAVTLREVGSGKAAAFTFDLARSLVYTHQGNPAWQIDHVNPLQTYGTALDLFYPDWVDFNRISIPQADEQQRFFANLILDMNMNKKPLPRFWYFPNGVKAVIILTGDDHWGRSTPSGSTQEFFERHIQQSPAGCVVDDWECVRSSSYGYPGALLTDAQAAAYTAQGFEFGLHADAGLASGGGWCGTWPSDMPVKYGEQFEALYDKYVSIPVQSSERSHCYSWFGYTGGEGWNGYAGEPEVEADLGIRLDTNIAYNPASWASVNPGYQMGSAMMMRFAQVDLDGTMVGFLDIYNAGTQMTDDNGQGATAMRAIVDSFLDAANGPQGFYGGFVVNMHSDNWYSWSYSGSDQIVASAQAHGVPVVSGRQMVDWLDGRNSSSFDSLTWDGTTLGFSVTVGAGARNAQAMVPAVAGTIPVSSISLDGAPLPYTIETIKGLDYAFFPANEGLYAVTYTPDETPPVISSVNALVTSGENATITWTTDELATSRVDYGTDPLNLTQNTIASVLVTAHTINLTGLLPNTQYYYRVSSTDASSNEATYPALVDPPETFTTPSASFIDTTVADFSAGTLDTNTYVSQISDGEMILAPSVGTEFSGSTLPGDWFSAGTGTVVVSGGLLIVDGARAGPNATFAPGHSLEAVATFGGAEFQHLGFGVNYTAAAGDAWAIISTGQSGTGLLARSWNGTGPWSTETSTPIPGSFFGSPHRYRIDWGPDTIEYYVDGVKVATHNIAITLQMRPMPADSVVGGATVSVDWMRMSPYASSGSFTSRVFDSQGVVTSGNISWDADTPVGTTLALSFRTGNTAIPDVSWSDFNTAANGEEIGSGFRYIQYKADLSTTDLNHTPTLQAVSILYNKEDDTIPPTVTGRSPTPDASDVALDTIVTVQFSEPMNASSIDTTSFRLRAAGASSDVPATVSYSGLTASLHPASPLAVGTTYQVTLAGSVTDTSNNPLGEDEEWSFTTVTLGLFIDDTLADFEAGSPDPLTYLAETGNGEVILGPAAGTEFSGSSLPEGWLATTFSTGGTATVGNGLLTLDGARLGTIGLYDPGHSLSGVATFSAVRFQHFGFAVTYSLDGTPWAIISTGPDGDGLYARTYTGSGTWDTESTLIPGDYFGTPHLYRVDWLADRFEYYVDGNLVATHNIAISTQMRPMPADSDVGGPTLSVDWLRMTPYDLSGTFTSRIFDAGNVVNWETLSSTSAQPDGTSISFTTRSGDTPTPDENWSDWTPIGPGSEIASSDGQYLQYQLSLSTTDTQVTPVVESVTISYTARPDLIFADGFESGNLSAWTSTVTGGGDLSVDPQAALVGNQGLQVDINDNEAIYLVDDSPDNEPRYRARFYFDPNSIAMGNNDTFAIFDGYSAATPILRIEFRMASGVYQMRVMTRLDSGAWPDTGFFPISDMLHTVELDWQAATADGVDDGSLTVWLDGEMLPTSLTGLDNDTLRFAIVALGAVFGVDTNTRGTIYFDAFESRRQSHIGPEGVSADFTAEPTGGFAPLMVQFTSSVLTSEPTVTYAWDFGDGGTSDEANPQHTYNNPGSYDVTLTVTAGLDVDIVLKSSYIEVLEATDLIFADGFETGDLLAWSRIYNPSGGLAVTDQAPMFGSHQLAVTMDGSDLSPRYLVDESPLGETEYHLRFYFDPNSIAMVPHSSHDFMIARDAMGEVIRMILYFRDDTYRIIVTTRGNSQRYTASSYPISDQAHYIEVEWLAAASGFLNLWVDGVQARSLTGVANDARTIEEVWLGPYFGLDSSTIGTYFFDAVESRRASYIGPEGVSADFTAEPTGGFAPLMVQFTSSVLTSEPTVTYAWDFGDGGTSDEANPQHTYNNPGSYDVTLTVTAGLDVDIVLKSSYIEVLEATDLIFADGFETGDLLAWSRIYNPSGGLAVTDQAPMFGSHQLAVTMDGIDRSPRYVVDESPTG